jgi:hypothetical protein
MRRNSSFVNEVSIGFVVNHVYIKDSDIEASDIKDSDIEASESISRAARIAAGNRNASPVLQEEKLELN